MNEADYLGRLIDLVHVRGGLVGHFRPARTANGRWVTPMQGDTGVPDLLIAYGGHVMLREVKTDTGRVRPDQQRWLDELGEYGGVWRPRDWAHAQEEIRRLTASRRSTPTTRR